MKILLTGGSGMVGRNVIKAAKKHSSIEVLYSPTRAEMNLFNYEETLSYIKNVKPDLIIHSAGRVGGIAANIANPVEFLYENVEIGKNVIMAAKEASVPKLLNLASSCVYPRNAQNPLTEDLILKGELEPTNEGYAIAKIVALKLCEYISKTTKLEYKTFLPCNLFGEYDHFDPVKSHLLPSIIMKLHNAKINNLSEVEIWGTGKARREFMLTEDLADIILESAAKFNELPNIMNVGLGFDFTIDEYYKIAAEVIGYKGNFKYDLSKPEGMKQKVVSVEKMKALGLSARTDLKTGIQKAYDYYLSTLK